MKVAPVHDSVQYLYLEYLQEVLRCNNGKYFDDKLIYKINRWLLKLLSVVVRLELGANYDQLQGGDKLDSQPERELVMPLETSARVKALYYFLCHICQLLSRQLGRIATNILTALHYLFTFHLIAAMYYQYSYDFDLMRLMKLRESSHHHWPPSAMPVNASASSRDLSLHNNISNSNSNTALELELIARMQETKKSLDFIGAPYSHMSITIETIYLYLVALSFIAFNTVNLYYRYVAPFELHVLRENLDYEGEQRHLRRLVATQAECFAKSECLFARIQSQCPNPRLMLEPHHYQTFGDAEGGGVGGADQQASGARVEEAVASGAELESGQTGCRASLSNELTAMLSSGALIPFTRYPCWFDKRARWALGFQAFTLTYMEVIFLVIKAVAIFERDPNRPTGTSDILVGVSICGLIAMVSFAALLFVTYSVIAGLDQVVLVVNLLKLVNRCVVLNSNEFFGRTRGLHDNRSSVSEGESGDGDETFETKLETGPSKAEPTVHVVVGVGVNGRNVSGMGTASASTALALNCQQASLSSTSDDPQDYHSSGHKMDTNLLFVLMHYKIFIAQAKPVIKSLDPVLLVFSIILMLIPLIVRFHLPYLDMFRDTDIRLFAVSMSLTMLVPANLCILPLCYFQSRCEDLYRALSSLLAHVIEVENEPNGQALYNHHAMLTLMRELRNPSEFTNQFKAQFASLSGTYTTLIRVHFWFGIITISNLVDSKYAGQASLESLLSDPLGVF